MSNFIDVKNPTAGLPGPQSSNQISGQDSGGISRIIQTDQFGAMNVNASVSVGTVGQGAGSSASPWYFYITEGGNLAVVTAAGALKVDGSSVTQPVEDIATNVIGNAVVGDAIQIGFKDASGHTQIPSAANPLPTTATFSGGSISVNGLSFTYYGSPAVEAANVYVVNPASSTISGVIQVSATSSANASGNPLYVDVTNTVPVTLTSTTITGNVAVTGTFYQATQPVSGTVAVSNFPASQAVTGTFWQATQPVSGTFWQTTQPVSGTVAFSNTTLAVTNTGTFAVQASIAASQTIAVTNAGTFAVQASIAAAQTLATVTTVGTVTAVTAITNALPAGTNTLGSVKITDGTNTGAVKAASTASVAGDTAQVVAVNPLSQPQVIGYMMDSTGVQRAISQVAFSSASSGAHTLVALSGSTKIYILSWWVSCGGTATNANLQSHTTTGMTTGVVNMGINGGAVFPPNNGTWVTGAAGEAVDFNLSGSNQVNGGATYCQF
jgi:hypothetical protein